MKKIITKNKNYLERNIVNLEVDEKSLAFINGLAVARVKIIYANQYNCYKFCIINKDYEEAFTYNNENDSSKILTLSNNNIDIKRVTENDFIVTSLYSNGSHCTRKTSHIKIENNIPKLINDDFYNLQVTKCPNIIISNGQLYNVKTGNFVTRKYHYIEEMLNDKDEQNKFFVTDKLIIDDNFADYLSFVINENDCIISPIYSEVKLDLYTKEISKLEYEQIRIQRISELKQKRDKSNQLIKTIKNYNL